MKYIGRLIEGICLFLFFGGLLVLEAWLLSDLGIWQKIFGGPALNW